MESRANANFLKITVIAICLILYCVGSSKIIGLAEAFIGTGIHVNSFPTGVAVNPVTNLIYVTNQLSNTVSVIAGNNDSIVGTIHAGFNPYGIAVDPFNDKIYVGNLADRITIIDGSTKAIVGTIENVTTPIGVRLDPIEAWIYVTNIDTNTLSKIDATTNRIVKNVSVGVHPYSVVLNDVTAKIYVTNFDSNTVSVIDGKSFRFLKNIHVGKFPVGLAVNNATNLIYATNLLSGTVSVINGSSDTLVKNLTVGNKPEGIDINLMTNKIYIANVGSNTISVLNGSTNEVIKSLPVNITRESFLRVLLPPSLQFPIVASFVATNPKTNLIYVTNPTSNTVSVINGITDSLLVGITFRTNPANSGNIYCSGQQTQANYIRYDIHAKVTCEAKANSGFTFSSWSPTGNSPSSTNPLIFTANDYGSYVANFSTALTLDQYQAIIVAYFAILTPVSSIIALITLIIRRRQKQIFDKKLQEIDNFDLSQDNYLNGLEDQRKLINDLLIKEKISESQYNLLKDRISNLIDKHK